MAKGKKSNNAKDPVLDFFNTKISVVLNAGAFSIGPFKGELHCALRWNIFTKGNIRKTSLTYLLPTVLTHACSVCRHWSNEHGAIS